MLEIRLLGGFDLAFTDGQEPGRLGPKPQGLLAILAMSRGRPVSRSRLAGLLWGERNEDLARHSLSQALTTIRTALGPSASDMLHAGPEGVRLTPGSFQVDVDGFEGAARSHRPDTLAEAFRLYGGEFLEGLEVREGGFEEWMLMERHRLAELAATGFGRLLEAQLAGGSVDAAVETARRLIAITPLDEAVHARLIELYGLQGRRGLAEAHYARCSKLLRRELGEEPGDELRAALSKARRCSIGGPAHADNGSIRLRRGELPGRLHRSSVWIRTRWGTSLAGLTVTLLLVAFAWGLHQIRNHEAAPYATTSWGLPAQPSIAVLPFVNLSNDPGQDWLVDGITRDIITDLSRFSTLFVTAASSTFRYKGEAPEVRDVAEELGVRYVLDGSLRRSDGLLRLNVNLVDAATGRQVWGERFERPAGDVFTIQKAISRDVAALIGSERGLLLQAEVERIARNPTSSLAAYELFQRGVHHRNLESKEDTAIARRMFERAVTLDPGYARAIANLGLTYLDDVWGGWSDARREWLRQAKELARRATEVDASESTGYMVLGLAHFLDSEYEQAIALLEKAKALNPNDDHILHALGYVLFYSGVSPGEGVALLEEMRRRNPHYPEVILRRPRTRLPFCQSCRGRSRYPRHDRAQAPTVLLAVQGGEPCPAQPVRGSARGGCRSA